MQPEAADRGAARRAGRAAAGAPLRSLYLRIYLTVVAVLLVFALVSAWVFEHGVARERETLREQWGERAAGWATLIQGSLPDAGAPRDEQRDALLAWSERLRVPLALDDEQGRRIATSEAFERRERGGGPPMRAVRVALLDGRSLLILRPPIGPARELRGAQDRGGPPFGPPGLAFGGLGLASVLVVLFFAIALGAYPVVRRLTRRLEALERGVETFGRGDLGHRVDDRGRDEVAAVASSFNRAAARVEALVDANRSLLANASHELRSPLARLKMAVSLLEARETGADNRASVPDAAARARLHREIERNIRELDALVEEVLLASRLDAARETGPRAPVALLPLAAEEAAAFDALASGEDLSVDGDERLLRRALRNLLENARRYGGAEAPEVTVARRGDRIELAVGDRGPGVPAAERERIFEPFYRLPGHAEQAGGVGLGLSLVRQIAERHGGRVRVEAREGGGSAFVLSLPAR